MMTLRLLSLLAALATGGCATYSAMAPLPFAELEYSAPDGTAWPAARLALPEIASRYAIATVPAVHYVELNPQGSPTVVFVHGLGSYLKFWRYNLDHFAAKGYRVVALDMLGYGKSDKPSSFPYTMEAMAEVVRALVDHLGVERPILVGHSMGGQTALSYAIRYPDAVAGLVLAAPAGFEDFPEREEQWYRQAVRSAFIRAADEDAIWGSVRHANFDRWRDDYAWLVEERVRVAKTPEFRSYAFANVRSIQGLADNDFVRDNLAQVKAPTVVIHGDADRLIPSPFFNGGFTRDVMAWGAGQMPDATLVTLEGCGHTVQIDCHDDFNRAAGEWLAARFPVARTAAPVAEPVDATPDASPADDKPTDEKPMDATPAEATLAE
ncbi:MAG: alpha/beta hydrolase [Myxococcales bacterium]|nr:alpha/beta hydrolase [Myxococcales bacterium]